MSQFNMIWALPCILLKMFGFGSFTIKNDRERMKGVLKILKEDTFSTSSTFEFGKLRPAGVFIGRWCCGYYIDHQTSETGTEVVIICAASRFAQLMDRSAPQAASLCLDTRPIYPFAKVDDGRGKSVEVWNRKGSYTSFYYRPFKIDLTNITPIGDQQHIINDIIEQYRYRKRLNVFIHGITGSGKSTVGLLVAKELGGSYCHDFNPTDPGDSFISLLTDIEHSSTHEDGMAGPVVIVLEEIDVIIGDIKAGKMRVHKNVCTSVHNKATFNSFLDDMVFHKNIILIMTSNTSKEEIDTIDSSCLRKGRVNAYYSMMRAIEL